MIVQWFCFAVLLTLLFRKAQIARETGLHCMDRNTTATINGFFICVVFLHHFSQYCKPSMSSLMGDLFGQLFVTTFFFYSGCGCAVQFLAKGNRYIQSFPRKRILSTVLRFDFAVFVFALVSILLGRPPTVRKTILSFLGWESVGNSNWYIFAIVLCYLAFYLAFTVSRMLEKWHRLAPFAQQGGIFAIVLGCALVLSRVKPPWWSDTLMAFPAGVTFGLHGHAMLECLKKRYWILLLILVLVFIAVLRCPFIGHRHWIAFNIKSVSFALIVVLMTMRIDLDSPELHWCGRHLFALYIYQRLPMVVFVNLYPDAFQTGQRWVFFCFSLAFSIAIAWLYEKGEQACLRFQS